MLSSTNEDYLKAVYTEEQSNPDNLAKTVKLAEKLNVTPGSATVMLQHMAKEGYIEYYPRKGCCLTRKGKEIVVNILRKHRLIELFLQKIMHFDWSEVHEEAEKMEHCFSEKVINRLDEILGHPKTDPHGEIIPDNTKSPEEGIEQLNGHDFPLVKAEKGSVYTITRITNQDTVFLNYMKKSGLVPGASIQIMQYEPVIDFLSVQCAQNNKIFNLSLSAAGYIYIIRKS